MSWIDEWKTELNGLFRFWWMRDEMEMLLFFHGNRNGLAFKKGLIEMVELMMRDEMEMFLHNLFFSCWDCLGTLHQEKKIKN